MITTRGHFLVKRYGTSVPILPPILSNEIIPLNPSFKTVKGKSKKFNGASGSYPNSNGSFPNSSALIGSNLITTKFNSKTNCEEFVDLFSIYGNILVKEGGELVQRYDEKFKDFSSYPLDSNLIELFENSVRFWYTSANENLNEKRIPVMMSINAPSRSFTCELGKHLIGKSGQSHLAVIPISMFHELLQVCSGKSNIKIIDNKNRLNAEDVEAKVLGDFILNNITNGFKSNKKTSNLSFMNNPLTSLTGLSTNSRSTIQVIEYLFACLESSVKTTIEGEKFTLLLDGFEDYFMARKGGEVVLKDLVNWSNHFESTGRRIVLGGRGSFTENTCSMAGEEESNENNPEDEESGPSNSNTSNGTNNTSNSTSNSTNNNSVIALPGNSSNSPFQMITDFFIKATGKKFGQSEPVSSNTNVRIEGPILRLFASGPKNDKRRLLKYSQLVSGDRKRDCFDSNMSLLRSIAQNRWNMNLAFKMKSKYNFPSNHPEIWGILSESGRGVLTKRKLNRDEFNEVIMYVLGSKSKNRNLTVESLNEALESVSQIRHDPTKFSSDDLNHLLAERQISMNSLSKYEKRFINCISTATTQTRFNDVSLPAGTVKTLKSLTSLPLTHPELFTHGILKNSLTGVLLFGPPGTGKTMLARAVAQESGAAFLAVNMSNIFDMWVGEGEKNVKGMFSLARKLSPSIIFIDEIDALLERRSSISGRSSRLEIVNEFMSQWDGLASNLNSGVIVMGATNRPFVLDDAVLRRLPRRLLLDLPDSENRLNILLNLLKDNLCENDLLDCLPEFVSKMDFYSGSDLKNVAITAGLKAAMRLSSDSNITEMIISKVDFEEALREVPASLSDQMDSLIELRKWNEMFGESKKGFDRKSMRKFGFSSG